MINSLIKSEYVNKSKKIFYFLFFSMVLLISMNGCLVFDAVEQTQLEGINDKSTDEQIKVYFNLLSNVSDDDMGSRFELSYAQTHALNALERIRDKKYINTFVDALDNESPAIRQAAINQMKNYEYRPAIPKLIQIIKEDEVQRIRFYAITTLTWLKAKSACPVLVSLANEKNIRMVSRTLTALTTIPCPQGIDLLLSYFKTGKINTIRQHLRTTIYGVLSNLKTDATVFIPYLTKLTHKKDKPNLNVISALQEIGGEEVESFFGSELKGLGELKYKDVIVDYILKLNSPSADIKVMDYIEKVQDSNFRELVYYSLKAEFREIKRRRRFVDRLIRNFEKETNKESRYKIAYMLNGIITQKHIGKIKYFIDNGKYHYSRCQLVKNLTDISTIKQFNYLKQFDKPDKDYACFLSVKDYLGDLKNKKVNNYLLSRYHSNITNQLKMSYLIQIGKYKSISNKKFIFKSLQNTDGYVRYAAATGIINQNISEDWDLIKASYLKEKDKDIIKKLLYAVGKFNNKEALDILKKAMIYLSTRSDAEKILLKKGFTESQIYEFY